MAACNDLRVRALSGPSGTAARAVSGRFFSPPPPTAYCTWYLSLSPCLGRGDPRPTPHSIHPLLLVSRNVDPLTDFEGRTFLLGQQREVTLVARAVHHLFEAVGLLAGWWWSGRSINTRSSDASLTGLNDHTHTHMHITHAPVCSRR